LTCLPYSEVGFALYSPIYINKLRSSATTKKQRSSD